MVKNIKGGSKHKKLARKNVDNENINIKTRLANPDEPNEMYARVTKIYGFGMVEVICNDGINRLCIIRNKFRGSNKRNNQVSEQSIILIGLREWEVLASDKKPKCDLLEVYSSIQHNEIRNDKNSNWRYLKPLISGETENNNNEVLFDNDGNEINNDAFEFADVDIGDI